MERKVFLSVLGTGYYNETKYFFKEIASDEPATRFVQYAAVKHYCNSWNKEDYILIFLTKDARETNWNHPAQNNFSNKKPYEGLSYKLEELGLKANIKPIPIPDGNNENEIWEIFQIVYNQLQDNDDVYFDITHAFRFLPMLLMVLINYSKFLKSIKIKSITYGNHQMEKDGYSPVIDITSLSQLQDWTSAANEFISFGSVKKISDLSLQTLLPLIKVKRGKDNVVSSLRKLSVLLPRFVKNIQTCRGAKIVENYEGKEIFSILNSTDVGLIQPLNPILSRIKNEMIVFNTPDNILNGFKSVDWCIRNDLIQQAITLLQEIILTYICDEMNLDHKKIGNRNLISSCINIAAKNIDEGEWEKEALEDKNLSKTILNNSLFLQKIKNEYMVLSNLRNDINHAGFTESAMKADTFKESINKIYCSILAKII